jgi:hypothetical protein
MKAINKIKHTGIQEGMLRKGEMEEKLRLLNENISKIHKLFMSYRSPFFIDSQHHECYIKKRYNSKRKSLN